MIILTRIRCYKSITNEMTHANSQSMMCIIVKCIACNLPILRGRMVLFHDQPTKN
jgi:hypothetical protein